MRTINSIIAIFYKEYKTNYRNYYDLLSIILFFLLAIFIFVFSIGPNKEIFSKIGVGLIWVILLLSSNLSIKRFYQEDFDDGNIFLMHISGLSFELIVLIKLVAQWIFVQMPFIFVIPIAILILDIQIGNLYLLLITFLLGSPVLTAITSISGAMNLLNNKNFAVGSVMVMILSIPFIIFSVGVLSVPLELVKPQLSILAGILLLFLAITPWISAGCIKLALKNK
tara:strand:+ start:389 stop:1063 length:675 start_codon:yes stop_codon:yes gene_type:complete